MYAFSALLPHRDERNSTNRSLNIDIDQEPTAAELAAASALIAAEQSTFEAPAATAAPEPSFSPAIAAELARVEAKQALPALPTSHYESQTLSPEDPLPALQNTAVSSTYLTIRNANLAALNAAGKNAWLLSNYHTEGQLRELEAELAATKREIDIINASRAAKQNEVKGEMQGLEENWKRGVGKVLETEIAVEELRAQIRDELKKRSAE